MKRTATFFAAWIVLAGAAHAQLTIEIIGGGANQIPIAVLPFAGESALPQSITEIVEQDLSRSGRFRALFVGGITQVPAEISQVDFAEWKSRLADAMVIGQAQRLPDGKFEVRFRLLDVLKQSQIGSSVYTLSAGQIRLTAHKIADFIYEKLTGERGVFGTKIAYVVKHGSRFELRVADADGQNAQSMVISSEPIMSLAWSPDGTRMAYVSFQNKKPILFVQSLSASQQPAPVANYKGSNSAPAWSPDGKQLAAVLTKDGSSQIYLMNADGTNLVYVSRNDGRFQVMAMDLETRQIQTLTDGYRDESPTFAPNGRMILYATDVDNRGVLAAVSSDGRFRQRLSVQAADVREPSWGPFIGN